MDFLSGAATDHLQLSSSTLTPLLNADSASEPIGGGNLSGVSKMITVNSTADVVENSDGVTTLREAINFANADTTEDAIVFDSSVFANQNHYIN
ncbi:MAG: CSLREA domain-containing protein [Rhizonema sp. NSF051]|nr:CSLREA domain-containing protein [Rhizonema sp. NSF051]